MTAVPYTATYQSWHSQHIPQSAEQLGPTMPGFDEHERHTFKDSSQQAVGEAQDAAGSPCAAAAFCLQHQAKLQPKAVAPALASGLQDLCMEMPIGFQMCHLPRCKMLQFLSTAVPSLMQNQQQRLTTHSSHKLACSMHLPTTVDHTRHATAQTRMRSPTAGRHMLYLQRPAAANSIPYGLYLAILLSTLWQWGGLCQNPQPPCTAYPPPP